MAGEPVIIFDTNSLRNISWSSAAFRQLVELSSSGKVRVFIPEVVYNERRTQWREEFAKANVELRKTLDRLAADPVLAPADQAAYATLSGGMPAHDPEQVSVAWFERFFEEADFELVGMTQGQAEEAFARYFAGDKPYKSVKARNDIPDGFVFAAVADLMKRVKAAYFLCSDKELGAAAAAITGVTLLPGVEDVLKEPDLIALRDELDTNKAWIAVRSGFPMDRARDELAAWVSERAHLFLEGKTVWSEKIPSDGNDGQITFVDEVKNLGFASFTEWGSGDLSTTITFTSDVEIEFPVYRGDAFSVPEWVSVSEGDFEKDDYFDATGSIRVAVKIEVSFRAVISDDYTEEDEVVRSVTPDHEPHISFAGGL